MTTNVKKKNDSSYSHLYKQQQISKSRIENEKEVTANKKINFEDLNDWDDVYSNIPAQQRNKNEETNENKNDFSINTSDFTNRNDLQNYDNFNVSHINNQNNHNEIQIKHVTPNLKQQPLDKLPEKFQVKNSNINRNSKELDSLKDSLNVNFPIKPNDINPKDSINLISNTNSNQGNNMPSTYFVYNKPIIQLINSNTNEASNNQSDKNGNDNNWQNTKEKDGWERESVEVKKSEIISKRQNDNKENLENLTKNLKKDLTKIEEEKSSISYNIDRELERDICEENQKMKENKEVNKFSNDQPERTNKFSPIHPKNKNDLSHHSDISQHIQQEIIYNQQVYNKYGNNFQPLNNNYNPNLLYQTPNFHYPTHQQFYYPNQNHLSPNSVNVNQYPFPYTQYQPQIQNSQLPFTPIYPFPNYDSNMALQQNNAYLAPNTNQMTFGKSTLNQTKKKKNSALNSKPNVIEIISKNEEERREEEKKKRPKKQKENRKNEEVNIVKKEIIPSNQNAKVKINREILNTNIKLGGLGPNIGSEEWSEKNKKVNRIKEFSKGIRQANQENVYFSPKNKKSPHINLIEENEEKLNDSLDEFEKIEKDFIKDMKRVEVNIDKRKSIKKVNTDSLQKKEFQSNKEKPRIIEEKISNNVEVNESKNTNNISMNNATQYSSNTSKTGYSHIHTLRNLKKQNQNRIEDNKIPTKDVKSTIASKTNHNQRNLQSPKKNEQINKEKESQRVQKKVRIKSAKNMMKENENTVKTIQNKYEPSSQHELIQKQIKRAQSSDLKKIQANNSSAKEEPERIRKKKKDEEGANDNNIVKYFYQNHEIESLYQNNQLLKQKVDKIKNFMSHLK